MEASVLHAALGVLGILATYFAVESRPRPSTDQELAELGAGRDETLQSPKRVAQ